MSSKKSRPPDPMARVPLPPPPRGQDAEQAPEAGLREGELVDARYRIEGVLGEGGVGRVYRALQVKLGRDVAVKVLLDPELADEVQLPRFEREAMALAALSHPNVVAVQDYGVWRGRPFIVMEMLRGESLRARLDAGPLPVGEALRVARELLRALAYTHSEGVVHRDLKPGNVFLQSFPTQMDHVKILDFGFAKFVDNSGLAGGPALTVAGTTMGTPAYVSPERLYGGQVDGRTDLYSVGILLFEMLSGRKPYDGSTSDILRAHLSQPVPRLAELTPGMMQSQALGEFLERALAKDVDDRFASAGRMLEALDGLSEQCVWRDGEDASQEGRVARVGATDLVLPRRSWLESLRPLAQRLPSGAQWRAASQHVLRRLGCVASELKGWLHAGYGWTEPRVRRGAARLASRLSDQRDRWRRRRGAAPKDAEPPRSLTADTRASGAAVSDQPALEPSTAQTDGPPPPPGDAQPRGDESTGSLLVP